MRLTQKQVEERLKEDKRKIDYLLFLQSQGGTPGSGTVTSVSVTSANGFTGTVASPGSTPAITLATSVTGILKGDGTAISSAVVGDIPTPLTTTGDMIYSSSGSTPARLGIGATNEFLTVQGGLPVWDSINLVVTPAGTGQSVLFDLGTDILYHKAIGNSTFISASTVSDSILLSLSATGTPDSTTFLRGDNTWAVPAGGGGANTALSNLAAVAINESLISDVDNTDDLGSSSIAWKDAYAYTFKLKNASGGITTFQPTASASNFTITFPASTGTAALTNGANTWTAANTFTSTLSAQSVLTTAATALLSDLSVLGSSSSGSITQSEFLPTGISSIRYRVGMRGSTAASPAPNESVTGLLIGRQTINETTTGNHDLFSSAWILAPTITGAAATVSNTATLYIDAAPSATVSGGNYALMIKSGNTMFTDGSLSLGTAGNKINIATGANASVGISGAMTAGSITISTTAVTANSIIQLTPVGAGAGQISIGTITAGTSFVINSSDGSDTRIVHWTIIN